MSHAEQIVKPATCSFVKDAYYSIVGIFLSPSNFPGHRIALCDLAHPNNANDLNTWFPSLPVCIAKVQLTASRLHYQRFSSAPWRLYYLSGNARLSFISSLPVLHCTRGIETYLSSNEYKASSSQDWGSKSQWNLNPTDIYPISDFFYKNEWRMFFAKWLSVDLAENIS